MNGILLKHVTESSGSDYVSWEMGTDEAIANMVSMDRDGQIDLRDYWSVGDERLLNISAIPVQKVGESQVEQVVDFVLLHRGGDNDDYRFIVGLKDCLYTPGRIHYESQVSIDRWGNSQRSAWLNDDFRNAIPSTFRNIFKPWTCITGIRGSSSLESVNVYFAIAAEKEIIGTTKNGTSAEDGALFQFDYYKTSANQVKKRSYNDYLDSDSSTYTDVWTRTPYKTGTVSQFCRERLKYDGTNTSSYYQSSNNYYISPIGRI